MNIIQVDSWLPIICPQRQFQDKEGSSNAYVDTNPSLYVNKDGNTTVLVRQVNYRKFKDRSFKLGENKSKSEYHILKGTYKNNTFDLNWESLAVIQTNLPKYSSYWHGPEDIRFVDNHTLLAVYPELNPEGNPRISLGHLDTDKTITFTKLLDGASTEKNWMPFTHKNSQLLIYSVSPLTIKPLVCYEPVQLHQNPELKGYHGSTNGIPFKNGYLFLVHKYSEKSEHRWLYLNLVEQTFSFSEPFIFFNYSYIEFPCSLVELPDGKLAVSLGVNDDKAKIAILDKSTIQLCEAFTFQ
jgi:hypothetical protein